MTFQAPCWSDIEVGRILKPDAEEISDHVFRAVHCPTGLQIADTADGERMPATAESLVSHFLDPNKDFVQAVVLGESGTGKSHLIQWLRLNIPLDHETVLITVPKTGTSLRGIVERLIERLPVEERLIYEQRLRQSGTQTASRVAKVDKFLDSLAWAIKHGGLASDEDRDLASLLPDVLSDPNFRKEFFLLPRGSVDAIVQHVFVDPELRDVSSDRREFMLGDLPLDGVRYNDASRDAKEAIDFIKGESGMDARAIALMNLNLDSAIAQTLNFSADNLIELMNSLRRHLAIQGKRLILLIEDFARLQGIDTALLQALITPPGQGEDRLCELRWAMAVTTGYFRRLEQTVRGRTTFVVDMDLSMPTSLPRLTAGYLNALRIGDSRLNQFPSSSPITSWCVQCEKKVTCLATFGESDGIGLFPFTKNAINVMSERSESLSGGRAFNPRLYLRKVLESVLSKHYQELVDGEFPSESLLKRIGGGNALRPIDRQKMEQSDPVNFARRNVFLELWDGKGKVVNLPQGIHDAFGIPLLRDASTTTSTDPEITEELKPKDPLSKLIPTEVDAVRRWSSDGKILSQNIVNELRQLIFSSLESFVDWDMLGYRKAAIASANGNITIPFRQVSINFSNQQTQRQNSLVMLDVSIDSALALEALLMNKHQGDWDFPDGSHLFANLLETLRTWGASVQEQLKLIYGGHSEWDPFVAAAELLVVTTYQSGRVKIEDSQLDVLVSSMWEAKPPLEVRCINKEFATLNSRLISNWPKMLEMLRNLSSGTKGGIVGNFVRVTPVLRAVRSLRARSLQLSQIPPKDSQSKELNELIELYRYIQRELPICLTNEKNAWREWLLILESSLSDGVTFASLSKELKISIDQVVSQGINAGVNRSRLDEILSSISPVTLDRALTHARTLVESNTADSLIRLASIGESKTVIDNLIATADEFLKTATASASNQRVSLEAAGGAGLRESEVRIEIELDQLSKSLNEIYQLTGDSK